jgi:hypothetical protein
VQEVKNKNAKRKALRVFVFWKLTHKTVPASQPLACYRAGFTQFFKKIFVLLGRIVNGLAIHDCRSSPGTKGKGQFSREWREQILQEQFSGSVSTVQ